MNALEQLKTRVAGLLAEQSFAALATRDGERLHNSLVCFAASADLHALYLCTPRSTRKYRNLLRTPEVALLIHSAVNRSLDLQQALAVTAQGAARVLDAAESARYSPLFLAKHPHLAAFLEAPSTALIEVRVTHYDLVSRFQDVATLRLQPASEHTS